MNLIGHSRVDKRRKSSRLHFSFGAVGLRLPIGNRRYNFFFFERKYEEADATSCRRQKIFWEQDDLKTASRRQKKIKTKGEICITKIIIQ